MDMKQTLISGLPELKLDLTQAQIDTLCAFGQAVIDQIDQQFAADDHNIQMEILDTFVFRVHIDLIDTFVFVHAESVVVTFYIIWSFHKAIWKFLFPISKCHICTACNMSIHHCFKIKVGRDICICQKDVFLFLLFQKIQNICQCASSSNIWLGRTVCIWRENIQTAIFTNQIPGTAASQMVDQ